MAFRLFPEVLDPVDVILLVSENLRVVYSAMMEVGYIERFSSPERVRTDDAVGLHVFPNDRQQGLCFGVWDDRRANLPTPLQKPEYRHLATGAVTALAFANSAEITLFRLDCRG